VTTYNITKKTGDLVGIRVVNSEDEIMLVNNHGIVIRLEVDEISQMGRSTRGVTLMRTEDDEKIVSAAKVYVSEVEAEVEVNQAEEEEK